MFALCVSLMMGIPSYCFPPVPEAQCDAHLRDWSVAAISWFKATHIHRGALAGCVPAEVPVVNAAENAPNSTPVHALMCRTPSPQDPAIPRDLP